MTRGRSKETAGGTEMPKTIPGFTTLVMRRLTAWGIDSPVGRLSLTPNLVSWSISSATRARKGAVRTCCPKASILGSRLPATLLMIHCSRHWASESLSLGAWWKCWSDAQAMHGVGRFWIRRKLCSRRQVHGDTAGSTVEHKNGHETALQWPFAPQFNDQPSPRPRTGVGTDRLRQSVSHGGQYHRQTTGVNLSLDTEGQPEVLQGTGGVRLWCRKVGKPSCKDGLVHLTKG